MWEGYRWKQHPYLGSGSGSAFCIPGDTPPVRSQSQGVLEKKQKTVWNTGSRASQQCPPFSAFLPEGKGSLALGGLLMTPRSEGKVRADTLSMHCLLLLGKCQTAKVTQRCCLCFISITVPLWSVWIASWHMTRGIRVKGMAEVLDKLLK